MITLFLAAAQAGDTGTSLTEEFRLRYHTDDRRLPGNEDRPVFNYVEQVDRAVGHLSTGEWAFDLQLDQVAFLANHYYLDEEYFTDPVLLSGDVWWFDEDLVGRTPAFGDVYLNPEKLRATWSRKPVTLTFGDFYAAFGRGIALNTVRSVEVDVDTSIQGIKGVFRPGDWDVTALMGTVNRQQVFQYNPNKQIFGDRRHAVAGARVERYGVGRATIGAHAVAFDFVEDEGLGEGWAEIGDGTDAVVTGATVDLPGFLGADWFVESDVFSYGSTTLFGGLEPEPGFAGYVSAVTYLGASTLLIETKRYRNAERLNALTSTELYEIATPPSLEYERAITEDSAAAVNSNDVWGARIRADVTAGRATPYASVAVFRDEELGVLHFNRAPEWIVHPIAGIEWFGEGASLIANTGFRVDRRDVPPSNSVLAGSDLGSDRQIHGDLDLKFDLFGPLHGDLATAVESYRWGSNEFQQTDYFESENAFTLQVGKHFWAIWYTDYTDNPIVNSVGNLSENWYGAGEVQVKPSSALTLKAFYGAYKAGIRCAGGQCRQLPGFEGFQFSLAGTL